MARTVREVTVEELEATREAGRVQLIDVRSPEEYATGHVPGAVNVPLEDLLAAPAASAPEGAHVVCQTGRRAPKLSARSRRQEFPPVPSQAERPRGSTPAARSKEERDD